MNSYMLDLRHRRDVTRAKMANLHEAMTGRPATADERAQWAAWDVELEALEATLRRLDAFEELQAVPGQESDLRGMEQRRAELCGGLHDLEAQCAAESRVMTEAELSRFDAAHREVTRLTSQIDRLSHEARLEAVDAERVVPTAL